METLKDEPDAKLAFNHLHSLLRQVRFTDGEGKAEGTRHLLTIKQISSLTGLSAHHVKKVIDDKRDLK